MNNRNIRIYDNSSQASLIAADCVEVIKKTFHTNKKSFNKRFYSDSTAYRITVIVEMDKSDAIKKT